MTKYDRANRPDPYADIELSENEIQSAMNAARADKAILIDDENVLIELDEKEIDIALRKARQIKSGLLFNKKYIEKIGSPIAYPKYSTVEFRQKILNKIRETHPKYIIDQENEDVFIALSLYFMRDPLFERFNPKYFQFKTNFDINKAIAIQGPIGCGKTSLMRGFNVNPTNCFRFIPANVIADEYTNKEFGGEPIIKKYSSIIKVNPVEYWGQTDIGLFIDDIGTEDVVKHYGNEKNVMEYILRNRYDNHTLRGKTHITTNLSKTQIEEFYGPRIRSRMEEMFNWLVFDPKSKDRRRSK